MVWTFLDDFLYELYKNSMSNNILWINIGPNLEQVPFKSENTFIWFEYYQQDRFCIFIICSLYHNDFKELTEIAWMMHFMML